VELPICEHIKMDGVRCGSPALRAGRYCYYHAGAHRLVPDIGFLLNPEHPRSLSHKPPQCGTDVRAAGANAIQVGFRQLIVAVAQELIDCRRAKLILKALHRASADLRQTGKTDDNSATTNSRSRTSALDLAANQDALSSNYGS
jgi:hypothetical protein